VRGVRLVVLDRHSDPRGSLLAFGGDTGLPFEIENIYFIVECPPDAVRGEHAVSDYEAIIALSSAVTVDLDNGRERESMRLSGADRALIVAPGVWMRLREFTPETRLVMLAARAHTDMQRFSEPQPRLVDDAES
jgi:WxcM-like, C-terminal